MNATLHQLKWDFRRVRTLWIVWLAILAGATFGSLYAAATVGPHSALAQIVDLAKIIVIYLLGIFLIARLMFSTPFTGTGAFWKTRPLPRRALFWNKTILILLLVETPVVLTQWTAWRLLHFDGPFLFWATLQLGTLTLAIFLLAAVWAALCERFASLWIGLASTGALLAVCATIYSQLAKFTSFLPIQSDSIVPNAPAATTSTLIAMAAILLVTATAAWFVGALGRNRPAAVVTIAGGIALIAGGNTLWRVDFLKQNLATLPEVTLQTLVLAQADPMPKRFQPLWNQVAIELPPTQTAHPSSWHSILAVGKDVLASASGDPAWSTWEGNHQQRLHEFYPAGTHLVFNRPLAPDSVLVDGSLAGTRGRLTGGARATIYEWRRLASLPLREGARARHLDGGLIRIGKLKGRRLEVTELRPPFLFTPQPAGSEATLREELFTYVLYDETGGMARVIDRSGYSWSGGFSLSIARKTQQLDLGTPRLPSLTGSANPGDARESLRLDVFQAVPVATAKLQFDKHDWSAYLERPSEAHPFSPAPKPAIAKTNLPANPRPEEVDAYLDGVLFTIPDHLTSDHWNRIEAELMAIGPEHLDHLLARLPVGIYAENLVRKVIPGLVEEAHKPAMLDALRRDPALAPLFIRFGWEADAAPVLAEQLRDHRPLDYESAPAAVKIVATLQDPATYDDLAWHFVHSQGGHREMAEALAGCPGFPLDDAIADLWLILRFESRGRRNLIAGLAARLGDKEALRAAFVQYAEELKENDLSLIEEAVHHLGGPALLEWIHRNFEALTYNPDTKTFGLP